MKKIASLLLFCLYTLANAQTTMVYDEKYVVFNLRYEANDTASIVGINWKKERPVSEFTLSGKTPLKYSIRLENDSIATLFRHDGKKMQYQDTIEHNGWPIRSIEGKAVISDFRITDFDKHGNEDLLCWVMSNVNGNQWTVIYLNDQKQKKLVKLMNNADNTDIWDYPQYNEKDRTIECELFSGAYGFQSNYTFRLENHIAFPLYKEERDYTHVDVETGEGEIIEEFIGENGRWKLKGE